MKLAARHSAVGELVGAGDGGKLGIGLGAGLGANEIVGVSEIVGVNEGALLGANVGAIFPDGT